MALLLSIVPAFGAAISQYNQTWADTDNAAAWTALGTSNSFWSTDNGRQLLIVNTSTTTTANGLNLTLESGPFIRGALGDKLYSLSTNKTYILGPFETSRFKQANGTIMVSLNASRANAFVASVP